MLLGRLVILVIQNSDIEENQWVSTLCICFLVLVLLPFVLVWTVLGTYWYFKMVSSIETCVRPSQLPASQQNWVIIVWLGVCYIVDLLFFVIICAVVSNLLGESLATAEFLGENQESLLQPNPPLDENELNRLRTRSTDTVTQGEVTCAICFEDFGVGELVLALPGCKHQFHSDCIRHWLVLKPHCPYCNNNVRSALRVGSD